MKKIYYIFSVICFLCLCGQANAACYIIGEANGNSWNPQTGVELTETGAGTKIYTGEITLSSNKYIGVADMLLTDDNWNYFNSNCRWYPKDGVRGITVGTKSYMQKNDPGYDNNSWGPTTAGVYNVTVDFNDNSLLLELLKEDNGLYLRGNEISGWETGTLLAETETPNIFKAENVTLSGFFKIGSSDWSKSYGPADNNALVTIGTPITLSNSGESKNMYLDGTYNATVVLDLTGESPVVTITGEKIASGVYLKGDMNSWSDNSDYQFTSLGGGVYELEKSILASQGKFKITANGLWYGADATAYDSEFEVTTWGGDMSLPEGTATSKFRFVISDDQSKGTLAITQGAIKEGIYLMGNVNSWNTEDEYKFTETETADIYKLENVRLQGYFKIADALWKDINIGGNGDGFLEVGETIECLNSSESVNFYLDGTYIATITLDLTGDAPTILLEGEQTTSGIFIYSAANQWGESEDIAEWEFIDCGEGIYILEKELLASDGEFCMNVNGVTVGATTATEIEYGNTYTLNGNQNLTLPADTRAESFEVLITDNGTVYISIIQGEEPTEPNEPTEPSEPTEPENPGSSAVEQINASNSNTVEYFNLQGIKISADKLSNGIYIKKQGTKTSKVVL